jgi:large repetitive protein
MGRCTGLSFIRYLFVFVALGIVGCAGTPTDFNTVVLRPSGTQVAAGGTVTITASVPKDTMNEGVTWMLVAGPGAPTPDGTFLSTNAEATFTAPANVSGSYFVTITATSIAFPTETKSVQITVQPPKPLVITTTTLPNGTLNAVYPGATLQATGGVLPYTWSITMGSLPAGLTLAPNGTISGTPTGTTTGTSTFTVQVSDGETPAMIKTASLSISVTNLLSGNYAFEFNGFNTSGAVVAAGTFTSDGVSKISGGVEDFNTIAGPPTNGTLETFTGTYTIGTSGRGTLTFNTSASGTLVYSFALDSTGLHGRLIESDSSGNRGSGEFAQQNVTTCASNTLSGPGPLGADFVIGVTGAEASFEGTAAGPFAVAGRLTAEVPVNSSTPGTIDTGEEDANAPTSAQPIVPDTTLSGTFQTSAQASRCTMSLSQQIGNMTFSVYPVTVSSGLVTEAYIVETDTVSATTPFISAGKLIHQTGYPFAESIQSFTAPGVVGLAGAIIPSGGSVYVPYAAVAAVQPSGGTGFNLALVQNVNGTVDSALGASALPVNFSTGDSFGRVDTTLLTPVDPVFYVINSNEALCLLENVNTPVLGILEPQSMGSAASFSASTIAATLILGTSAPATAAVQNFSGVTTLTSTNTSAGTVTGTEDLSTTGGNSLGLTISGTYGLTATGPTDGSGILSLTQAPPPPVFNGAFFIVSPTKAVMITTTAGDTNPVLVILGDQTDDFGVN